MIRNWTIKNKKGDFEKICREHGISEVTARLLVNRGLMETAEQENFLHPSYERGMHSPFLLKNAEAVAEALVSEIEQNTASGLSGIMM